jgi:hypothetical protein
LQKNRSGQLIIELTGLAVVSVAGFVGYRRWRPSRIERVKTWVTRYLAERYGVPPARVSINGSDDPLGRVLVGFDDPGTGARLHLRFACAGSSSTFALMAEQGEKT